MNIIIILIMFIIIIAIAMIFANKSVLSVRGGKDKINILIIPGLDDTNKINTLTNKLKNENVKVLDYYKAHSFTDLVNNANEFVKSGSWVVVAHSAGTFVAKSMDTHNIEYMIFIDPTPDYAVDAVKEDETGIISWFKDIKPDTPRVPIEVHYNVDDGKEKDIPKEKDIISKYPLAIRHANKTHWIWMKDLNSIYKAILNPSKKRVYYNFPNEVQNVIGHIAGTSGSGKTHIGELIQDARPDIIVKDIDELSEDFSFSDEPTDEELSQIHDTIYQRLVRFAKDTDNSSGKNVLFVGYNADSTYWINIPGKHWYLDVDAETVMKQRKQRNIKLGIDNYHAEDWKRQMAFDKDQYKHYKKISPEALLATKF